MIAINIGDIFKLNNTEFKITDYDKGTYTFIGENINDKNQKIYIVNPEPNKTTTTYDFSSFGQNHKAAKLIVNFIVPERYAIKFPSHLQCYMIEQDTSKIVIQQDARCNYHFVQKTKQGIGYISNEHKRKNANLEENTEENTTEIQRNLNLHILLVLSPP